MVKVNGVYALRFMPGNKWTVGAGGKLLRPICAAAVRALNVLEDDDWESGLLPEITCDCPLVVSEVTFTVEADLPQT